METKKKVRLIVLGVILGGIFHTLFIDNGWAIDWNETVYTINATEDSLLTTINPFYNPEFDKWYIQTNIELARISGDLSNPSFDYPFSRPRVNTNCGEIQCSPRINSQHNYSVCITRGCVSGASGGYGDMDWGYSANPPFTPSWTNPAGTVDYIGISQVYDYTVSTTNRIRLFRINGGSSLYWCDWSIAGVGGCSPLEGRYNGTLTIPAQYSDHSNEILFERIEGNYFLFFISNNPTGTDQVYYTQYDSDFNNYGGVFRLSEFSAYNYLVGRNPFFLHNNGEFLLAYTEKLASNNRSVIIDHYAENQDGFLQLLYTERFDPPNVVDGSNQSLTVGLARDNYRFWLFYQVTDGATSEGIYAIAEDLDCNTGTWYNATGEEKCVGDYQRQRRTVNPPDCADSERFELSGICEQMNQQGITDPDELQLTKVETDQTICYGDWIDPFNEDDEPSSFCSLDLEISSKCSSNINTSSTYENQIQWGVGGADYWALPFLQIDLTTRFTAITCHPMNDCFEESAYLCFEDYNRTVPQETYNYYSPSSIAQADFETFGSDCKQRFLGINYGWDRYRVKGTLTYSCDVECGDRSVCIKKGKIWYSIPETNSCNLNYTAEIECNIEEICEDGACISEVDDPPERADDLFQWLKDESEDKFPDYALMGVSVLASVGLGIWGYQSSESKEMGLAGMLGGMGFFLMIDWIPQIFGILWIITVTFILVNEYRKGVEK
jgi:hypothetical protein